MKSPASSETPNPAETQDGGLRAWTCVAGAFLCQFCSFGFINAYVSVIYLILDAWLTVISAWEPSSTSIRISSFLTSQNRRSHGS